MTAGFDARVARLSAAKRTLLARRLDRAVGSTGPRALPRRPGVNTFPTSSAQERLWFLQQVAPASTAYNVVGAFELVGPLNLGALQGALDGLVARHETLRTTFDAVDGVPRQVVSPLGSVRVRVATPESVRALRRDLDAPFDVTRGPLLRITLYPVAPEHHVVSVAMHHLISDAWSITVFTRDLAALYRAALADGPARLPDPIIQYGDYAAWQRGAEEAVGSAAIGYWRERLAGAAYPPVPAGPRLGGAGAAQAVALTPELVDQVHACTRRSGTTLFVTTLAAWIVVLAARSRLDDVTVLAPVANRERPEVAGIIGFFVNLVALRVRLDDDPDFGRLLERLGETVRGALRHQAVPFEAVLTALGVERSLTRPPFSPFAFAVERADVGLVELPGVTATVVPLEVTTAKTDLMLVVVERAGGLTLRLEYDRTLYDEADVTRLLDAYRDCLAAAVADPRRRVSALQPGRPHGRVEQSLRAVWEEVLGRPVPSSDADFFALGGDSLSSIRVVARARRRGLVFAPREIFEHRTVAALARVVRERAEVGDEQGPVVGPVALTPIQRLLLEADVPDLHHFNMATMLLVEPRPEPALLAIAVEHLLRHHDALRLRVRREGTAWRQIFADLDGTVPFAHVDLAALDDARASAAIAARASHEQTTLDLVDGPILRVVVFDLGATRPSRVLVVVHHLGCDAVSWPILLDDLATLYGQLQRGDAIELPPKSTSFRRWAERLATWEREAARADDAAFWRRECAAGGARLPRRAATTRAAIADVRRVEQVVDREPTAGILRGLAERGVSVEAAGLAGLAIAVGELTGEPSLLVYLERHGRDVIPDLDVSRTVGWFTAVFPVRIAVAPSGSPPDTLAGLVEHLREVPHGGAGFGTVRADLGATWHRPEVSFNYLGHGDPSLGTGWRLAPESAGPEVGGRGTRPTLLDVTAVVIGGALRLAWDYDRVLLERATIERIAARTLAVVRILAAAATGDA